MADSNRTEILEPRSLRESLALLEAKKEHDGRSRGVRRDRRAGGDRRDAAYRVAVAALATVILAGLAVLLVITLRSDSADAGARPHVSTATAADDTPVMETEAPATEPVDHLKTEVVPAAPRLDLEGSETRDQPGTTAHPSPEELMESVEDFAAEFSTAHETRDVEFLLDTLHPAVPEAFGETECWDYVLATAGSIQDMQVLMVGELIAFELPGPTAPISFDQSLSAFGEWTVASTGDVMTFEFHLIPTADGWNWLTTCGQPTIAEV